MNFASRFGFLGVLALVGAASCGGGTGKQLLGPQHSPTGPYPPGPYGTQVSSTIDDLTFMSSWQVDPANGDMATDANASALSFHDFYRISPMPRWLIVNVSAGWCVACQGEQTYLLNYANPSDPKWGGHGIGVLEVIFQDYNEQSPGPATPAVAEKWINSFNLTFPVAADPTAQMDAYFDSNAVPLNMIVDTRTMKIVWKESGFDQQAEENELCTLAGISC